ncbi:Imm26 family immunity protein [Nocardioides sp. HB32]
MVKLNYAEGDWFAVPLRTTGFALGIIARANPKAALLGYFFGPLRPHPPGLDDTTELLPHQAILVGRFSHLGIRGGSWPLLRQEPGWDRSAWPTPIFVRYEELTGRTFHVHYDDADPARLIGETLVARGLAEQGPRDGLMGAGYVELRLTALLT